MGTDHPGELAYSTEQCSIVTLGPVFIDVVHQPATAEVMGEIRRRLGVHTRAYAGKNCTLSVLKASSMGRVNPGVKEEASAMAREIKNLGSAVVVEGSGFGAAMARTLLTAVYLIGQSSPLKVFKTVEDGAAWLSALLSGEVPAKNIVAVVDQARRGA